MSCKVQQFFGFHHHLTCANSTKFKLRNLLHSRSPCPVSSCASSTRLRNWTRLMTGSRFRDWLSGLIKFKIMLCFVRRLMVRPKQVRYRCPPVFKFQFHLVSHAHDHQKTFFFCDSFRWYIDEKEEHLDSEEQMEKEDALVRLVIKRLIKKDKAILIVDSPEPGNHTADLLKKVMDHFFRLKCRFDYHDFMFDFHYEKAIVGYYLKGSRTRS